MAIEKKEIAPFISKSLTTEITAESGITIPINTNGNTLFYKIDFVEKRQIPIGADLNKEVDSLWDHVNQQVDSQARNIISSNAVDNKK